jgi:hypothetical protein
MVAVNMTPAQARAAGIATGAGKGRRGGSRPSNEQPTERAAPSRSTRRTVKGAAYHTRCCTEGCGEQFTTEAAERRHNESTRHARYELVLSR